VSIKTEHAIDLVEARRTLDADHFGLQKVKRRILEYLAVQKLKPGAAARSYASSGPPASQDLARPEHAKATGRKFVRASLGGVHDEARSAATAGPIRRAAGQHHSIAAKGRRADCVMMLDEIDKLGQSFQGDPGSALLDGARSEQNRLRDNYLGVRSTSRRCCSSHRQTAGHSAGRCATAWR